MITSIVFSIGVAMISAWGVILPLGLAVALMCKSICPGKGFLYVSYTLQ